MTAKSTAQANRPGASSSKPKSQHAGLVQKVHVAKGQLALSDESYRDLLNRIAGKASSKACSIAELEAVLAEFERLGWDPKKKRQPKRAGKRPVADGEVQGKIHALWLALYHLGVVRSPEEAAIDTFVKRQTGCDSLRWLPADQADRAIEALKSWATRDAGVRWPDNAAVRRVEYVRMRNGVESVGQAVLVAQKKAVIEAQWRLLQRAGAFERGVFAGLDSWLLNRGYPANGPEYLSPAECDEIVETLGAWLRRQLRQAGKTPRELTG